MSEPRTEGPKPPLDEDHVSLPWPASTGDHSPLIGVAMDPRRNSTGFQRPTHRAVEVLMLPDDLQSRLVDSILGILAREPESATEGHSAPAAAKSFTSVAQDSEAVGRCAGL